MGKAAFWTATASTVAVVSIIGNVLLFNRYSSQRPLFEVNGQVIHQKDLQDRLDYQYSNHVLRDMILNDLVMQEAAKEGVIPTDQDVAQAKDRIQRTKPQLITAAAETDPSLELFDAGLKAKLALQNLEVQNVTVSEADVQQYYNAHKADFALPAQTSSSVVYARDSMSAYTAEQMLKNGVGLPVIAQQQGLAVVGINAAQVQGIPQDVVRQVLSMGVGDVKTFPIGNIFMVIRSNAVESAGVPPLAVIHDQVELAARQAKGLGDDAELGKLVQQAHITVESDKYSAAVPKVSGSQIASAQ